MRAFSVGPSSARIAIVGEAHGESEERLGRPFAGSAGYELEGQLKDAGLNRDECYITNVVQRRPPNNKIEEWIRYRAKPQDGEVTYRGRQVQPFVVEEVGALHDELARLRPKVIIALGGTSLWALTSAFSISKWRGSHLKSNVPGLEDTLVLPTYHPAYVLRSYSDRYTAVQDLRRAKRLSELSQPVPQWRFITNPTFAEVVAKLQELIVLARDRPLPLAYDLEIKRGEIVCAGIGWSRLDAICIPFYNEGGRCWSPEETSEVWFLIYLLLAHPNVRLFNQNITFDIQFTFEDVGFWPPVAFDTMVAQHVIFPGEPKSLDYLASLYCDYYVYWKDDGKFWNKPIVFPQLWHYNCLDCAYTFEVYEAQLKVLATLGLEPQMAFMMRQLPQVLRMMFRGVAVDRARKGAMAKEIKSLMATLTAEAEYLAGQKLTGDGAGFSPDKLKKLFYTELGLPPITKKYQGRSVVTCDDDALAKIAKREPWLKPLTERINKARSYKTALSVCQSRTDPDGRWRSSLNIAGTESYRYSSSENPFGTGLNMQNITVGKDITV